MAIEQTLSMIKPDGVHRGLIGDVIGRFEKHGLKIRAMKMLHLSLDQARAFYAVHQGTALLRQPDHIHEFRTHRGHDPGGENAIQVNRDLMGATDYRKADPGTIRADFARDIEANIVHGSDAPDTAKVEIAFFFNALEQV